MVRAGGVTVVLVATGTAACGLMMIAGVGPTRADAAIGDTVPAVADTATADDSPYSTSPSTTSTPSSSTTLAPTATSTTPITTTNTTTPTTTTPSAPTTTSTTSTTTTSTTSTVVISPVPLSVSPRTITVGPGATARISGTCGSSGGIVAGPVEIWQVGSDITVIHTGVTAASWTYEWTAPTTVGSLVLQPWCGPPVGYVGGFPAELQIEVIFVDQQGTAPTSTSPPAASGNTDPSGGTIPETD